jgi:hypothetical protein
MAGDAGPPCIVKCEMNAKHFRWLFLLLLAGLVLVAFSLDAATTIGLSGESSGDKYRIAGGTAPWALLFAALTIGLYSLLMSSSPPSHGGTIRGWWWRRLAAFWLDFFLALMATSPILGLLPVLAEWRRTGVFAWSFERTTPAPGDGWLFAAMFAIALPSLAIYYIWPLVRGRPTPGACIMGYQIVANNGSALTWRAALMRALLGLSFLRDWREKTLRIDEESATHAVELE